MKRAVLITGHFPQQKRKASMLWVSEHLQAMGWHVTVVTVGYSWLSRLKGDARLKALDTPPSQSCTIISPTLTALFGLPLIHPFKTRINPILEPLFSTFARYWHKRLQTPLATANLVICESGLPILLAPTLATFAPQAPRVYRVNDDIRLLNAPNMLIRAEMIHQNHFIRISTASPVLARRFAKHPNVTIDPMGIPKDAIRARNTAICPNPNFSKVAVCAGTTQLDILALVRIASQRPEWQIDVLGRLKFTPPALPNITWHGEQSFATTLTQIANADIGLAPYIDAPGIEYQTTNSNRILLYRHFGLPTLGPDRLCTPEIPSVIGYNTPAALERCAQWINKPEAIPDWSELAQRLIQNGETEPPNEVSTAPETMVKSRVKTVPAFASNA